MGFAEGAGGAKLQSPSLPPSSLAMLHLGQTHPDTKSLRAPDTMHSEKLQADMWKWVECRMAIPQEQGTMELSLDPPPGLPS